MSDTCIDPPVLLLQVLLRAPSAPAGVPHATFWPPPTAYLPHVGCCTSTAIWVPFVHCAPGYGTNVTLLVKINGMNFQLLSGTSGVASLVYIVKRSTLLSTKSEYLCCSCQKQISTTGCVHCRSPVVCCSEPTWPVSASPGVCHQPP